MKKVITYGTYDFLHYGHIRLLERAKALGDYLIVGVTSEDFDRKRGKINVRQSLAERINNVRRTGLADEIIVEEYIGQKIDDIKRYGIDTFVLGSDWEGKFDYLKEYCNVVYLPRTEGISSTQIRCEQHEIKMGVVGDDIDFLNKYCLEDNYVNGIKIIGICTNVPKNVLKEKSPVKELEITTDNLDVLLSKVDAVYINSPIDKHYDEIMMSLKAGKHVLCESPICNNKKKCKELFALAKKKKLILMDANRTSYAMAYSRLLLLIKGGEIGNVLSVEASITNMSNYIKTKKAQSFNNLGAQALIPILDILGCNFNKYHFYTKMTTDNNDLFTRLDLVYDNAIATLKVAEGAKSEGELIVTGTNGYLIVPSPWWKPDYFEIRYENMNNNKRYFYQLNGEGIRNQLLSFINAINGNKNSMNIQEKTSITICDFMDKFQNNKNLTIL